MIRARQHPTEPAPEHPTRFVRSPDGTPIAVFSSGGPERPGHIPPRRPPLVLVHGTTADHTTFRVVGPLFEGRHVVHAIDRRGRGASGDMAPYSVEREFEDLAAVADVLAAESGGPLDVLGHSFGGRCALGASLLTPAIRRLVSYEGAPAPPGTSYQSAGLVARLRTMLDADHREEVLETFLREVVGMTGDEIGAYRVNLVWPARVAAAPTIVRELEAESSTAASLDVLARARVPILQILGGASRPIFGEATRALDASLAHGRIVVIDGAKHAAHHTHPGQFVGAVEDFLAAD